MATNMQGSGQYTVKESGESIAYEFKYQVINSVEDAVELLGEEKTKSLLQRMLKVDANNTAREKAKSANGHSTKVVMSEEEKAEKKVARQANKALLDLIKAKGLSLDDIENM